MAKLEDIKTKLPTAEVVAGTVQAYIADKSKHVVLGQYLGNDDVALTSDAEALLAELAAEAPVAAPKARRAKTAEPAETTTESAPTPAGS